MQEEENQRYQVLSQSLVEHLSIGENGSLLNVCSICFWQYSESELYSIDNCKHVFCLKCQIAHIEQSLGNLKYPQCLEEGCGADLSTNNKLYQLLPASLKQKTENIKNYRKRLKDPNSKPCQKPDCIGFFDMTKTRTCMACRSVHCGICNGLKHEGECQLEVAINLQMNNKYRQCSKCGLVIQKTKGCSHIRCTCGNYFCYFCGDTLLGQHQCKLPENLSFLQSVRWELQHLQLWYQRCGCSCLRVILCFSPPKQLGYVVRLLWVIIYILSLYPLLIMLSMGMVVAVTAGFLSIFLLFVLMLPFIGISSEKLMLVPTWAIRTHFGCCAAFLTVILLYPVLLVLNLLQFIYFMIMKDDFRSNELKKPFVEMGKGLRYVLLSPCIMLVSNQLYYVENAQLRQPKNDINDNQLKVDSS